MTGTSCDGIDFSCLEFSNGNFKSLWNDSSEYPELMRDAVLMAQQPDQRFKISEIQSLNSELGKWFAKKIIAVIKKHNKPDVIANHGQTIFHDSTHFKPGITLQSGSAAVISEKTGLTVISNFREGDLASGGKGAPLATTYHQVIAKKLPHYKSGISIHNLGGISNFTYIHPKHKLISFDTGPANIWIDAAVKMISEDERTYDHNGDIAAIGKSDKKIVAQLLKNPFFKINPPKATGKDDFPDELFFNAIKGTKLSGFDVVATATELSAKSIADSYTKWIIKKKLPLKQIYFTGGGSKNKTLLRLIQEKLPQIQIGSIDEHGHASNFIESSAFAYLGYLTLLGSPVGGAWTGASTFAPPGQILPGKNWNSVLDKI